MLPDIVSDATTIVWNPAGLVPGMNSDIAEGSEASIFQMTLPGLTSELLAFSLIVTDRKRTSGHISTKTAPRLGEPEP